jgi:hypothetical protein
MINPDEPLSWEFLQDYKKHPYKYTGLPRKYSIDFKNNRPYILIENKFPYNVSNEIKHMILFINPNNKEYTDFKVIENIIKINCYNLGYNDYLFFEQPIDRRSITSITHHQIFYRNKNLLANL